LNTNDLNFDSFKKIYSDERPESPDVTALFRFRRISIYQRSNQTLLSVRPGGRFSGEREVKSCRFLLVLSDYAARLLGLDVGDASGSFRAQYSSSAVGICECAATDCFAGVHAHPKPNRARFSFASVNVNCRSRIIAQVGNECSIGDVNDTRLWRQQKTIKFIASANAFLPSFYDNFTDQRGSSSE